MAARLTDKQKKKIIADYVEIGSLNAVAQKHKVSRDTVKRIVSSDEEIVQKTQQKKDENSKSILAHMESQRDVVNEIITKGLGVLNNREKLEAATPSQITTAMGTLIDKFTPVDKRAEEDRPYELPARVIGRAFVDLNREIKPNISYVLEGGRGGLKSSFISVKIVELIKNNPQMHACITRQVANTLKDSVYNQMKWAINILGLNDEFSFKTSPLEIVYKKTGQTIPWPGR